MSNDKDKGQGASRDEAPSKGAGDGGAPEQEAPAAGAQTARPKEPDRDAAAPGGKSRAARKKGAETPGAPDPVQDGATVAPSGKEPVALPARGRNASLPIAILAFLLSLAVGGALFYLWQQAEGQRTAQAGQLQRMAAEIAALGERQNRLDDAFARTDTARTQLAERLDGRLDTVERGLSGIQDRTSRRERGWQLAEVKHLQRMATHRLHLMDDPDGATRALQAADQLLAELGEPRLLPVREALAGEIQALQDMDRPDIAGLALRLERLADDLRPMPLKGQALPEEEALIEVLTGPAPGADAPWWARAYAEIRQALAEHISIRRHGEPIRGLPDAGTELFLRQLLTLRVEAARIAVLRHDDAAYQRHLAAAAELLEAHFSADAAGPVLSRLRTLQEIRLRPEAPDIGTSFTLLDELE